MEKLPGLFASIAIATLCACAAPPAADAPAARVALLPEAPEQPYRSLGFVEVRGRPGMPHRTVHDKLREEARALGADAVIVARDVRRVDRPAPLAPVRQATTQAGIYYEVGGEAIRFTGPPTQNQGGAT